MIFTLFKRKIETEIEKWYRYLKVKKIALIIKGLRQVGKTTTVRNFCAEKYENVVYINFIDDFDVKTYFDGNLNVDEIIMLLKTRYINVRFVPYKTILIFDEIQECANARAAIKSFMEDGRYDIIATGSLLGTRGYNLKNPRSVPVGFEQIIEMKAMDFEEFLWAKGVSADALEYVKNCFANQTKIPDGLNKSMFQYFREYLCVGGMPEAVRAFVATRDIMTARNIQTRLLASYQDDFGKHLNESEQAFFNKTELTRILEVYRSISLQLARANKKFVYRDIAKQARAREYLDPIIWLEQYGLVRRCYNLKALRLPLDGYKIAAVFKIYVADVGLFAAMLDESIVNRILTGDLGIYKGPLYENAIADAFLKTGKELYYFAKSSGLEIDFITTYRGEITAIEVKAGNNKSKALKEVLSNKNKYDVTANFKLIDGNIGKSDLINTIPLYAAYLID